MTRPSPSQEGLGGSLLDLLLPPACSGCGGYLPAHTRGQGERICPGCRARLRAPSHPRCPRCAAPRGTGLPETRPCTECHEWPEFLRLARSAVVLAPPADTLVHQFKYGGWPELAGEMADRIARMVHSEARDFIGLPLVPIPTTPGRERRRGYNQARVLAQELRDRLASPLAEALARREGGESQVSLDRGARRENVRRAFLPEPSRIGALIGREVVLVDDVLTTGATALAAAETLVDAGVGSVLLLTFARALPD